MTSTLLIYKKQLFISLPFLFIDLLSHKISQVLKSLTLLELPLCCYDKRDQDGCDGSCSQSQIRSKHKSILMGISRRCFA